MVTYNKTDIPICLKKAIFFIGVPRSGTTIIFEAFSTHEDLAWFSNLLLRFPNTPAVSILSRVTRFNLFRGAKHQNQHLSFLKRKFPYSAETYSVWESLLGAKFRTDYLTNRNADPDQRNRAYSFIEKVIRYHGKKRFSTKITGPSRIHFINSIFPDTQFIHIIRDGRAVVNSLINASFWIEGGGYDKPWWANGLTEEDLEIYERYNRSPLALAAVQWRRIILIARQEAESLEKGRYIELKNEDFMAETHERMSEVLTFCGLKPSSKVTEYINSVQYRNMNYKYLESFNKNEIDMLNEIMGDTLVTLGYPFA